MKTKIMKLSICLLIILFCGYGCGTARFDKLRASKGDHPPALRAKMMTRQMETSLKLDATQKDEISKLNLKYALMQDAVVDQKMGDLKTVRQMSKVAKAKDKELKKALSKEQYKLYLKSKEELQEKVKEALKNAKKKKDSGEGIRRRTR